MKSKKLVILIIALATLTILIAVSLGSASVSIGDGFAVILRRIPVIGNRLFAGMEIKASVDTIIWRIRLPRVLLSFFVGAALSISGATFQGIFKNPMADPFVIGVSSGAALGAAIGIISKISLPLIGNATISVFAFIGAIMASFLVYNLARIKNKIPTSNLLLSGVAVSYFLTSMVSMLMFFYSKDIENIIFWTLGSFSGKGWSHFGIAVYPIIASFIVLIVYSRDLNIILTGEENAQSMGVNSSRLKKIMLFTCSVMTGVSVSLTGIIGFVGLVVPHVMRLIFGPDHRILIPTSFFAGGIFLVVADTLARNLLSPSEIPIGIITAIAGGPFFLYLLRKRKRGYFD